jgi:hypothetical protein
VSETAPDPIERQCRLARRLGRLFRIERNGGFERLPAAVVSRLVARRGTLIAELAALDRRQRLTAQPAWGGLDRELTALRREVERTLGAVQLRLQRIGKDLRISRGEGSPTGLRDGGAGRHLGTS